MWFLKVRHFFVSTPINPLSLQSTPPKDIGIRLIYNFDKGILEYAPSIETTDPSEN